MISRMRAVAARFAVNTKHLDVWPYYCMRSNVTSFIPYTARVQYNQAKADACIYQVFAKVSRISKRMSTARMVIRTN